MTTDTKELGTRYLAILREYVRSGSEASLSDGYAIARRALVEGYDVLDMAAIHHRALRRLIPERKVTAVLLASAERFFAECLSPFEMNHRGAQEGARALLHLNEVLEAELKSMAHALHDEAGQLLASVHIAMADMIRGLPPSAQARFVEVESLFRQVEGELRNLSHGLRPEALDHLGLVPALECLAEKVAKRTGLQLSVAGKTGERLPATIEMALYRIVQEAVNNAVKHAYAHSVCIDLQRTRRRVRCAIRDDGVGFDAMAGHGFGLSGIRERLRCLGGSLSVITEAQHGTTLLADIPLAS